jgi:lipid II isoglutaminyl synthase (glutamine-hydrolysing)
VIEIVHLYPDLLGTYGDRGNVVVLESRLRWRGIDVAVTPVERGGALPRSADIIFMGGGQDRAQELVAPELVALAPDLAEAAADGAVVFAVCGGYQLLGTYYRTPDGDVPGLGLLDAWTETGPDRILGNASVRCSIDGIDGSLVGFENHGGRTHLGPLAEPLGTVLAGRGNNGVDRTEGAVQGNIIATYLHGPVLPRNAWFADVLLARAVVRHGIELAPLDDTLEEAAHRRGLELAKRRRR